MIGSVNEQHGSATDLLETSALRLELISGHLFLVHKYSTCPINLDLGPLRNCGCGRTCGLPGKYPAALVRRSFKAARLFLWFAPGNCQYQNASNWECDFHRGGYGGDWELWPSTHHWIRVMGDRSFEKPAISQNSRLTFRTIGLVFCAFRTINFPVKSLVSD